MTLPYHYTSYIWPMLAPAAFTVARMIYVWRRRTLALRVIPRLLHLFLVFTNDAHHWLWLGFSFLIPVAREQEPTFAVASAGLRRVMLPAQSLVVSL